jgi:aspartate beta-hydroxylase
MELSSGAGPSPASAALPEPVPAPVTEAAAADSPTESEAATALPEPVPPPAIEATDSFQKLSSRLEAALKQQGLSKFSSTMAIQFVSSRLQSANGSKMKHAVQYLLGLLNRIPRPLDFPGWELREKSRHRCPQLTPGLAGKPFWDTAQLPWVRALEDAYADIRTEFFALREQEGGGFQNYRSPRPVGEAAEAEGGEALSPGLEATDKGQWNVCYFYLHGMDFAENLSRCPLTQRAIEAVPRHYHHALFSSLAADTHVKPHCGPTNKKLRCHLPIFVPPAPPSASSCSGSGTQTAEGAPDSAWLRVGGEFRILEEGRCVVFDDSFEHEAANPSLQPRAVLIIDVWHPDLSDEEVSGAKLTDIEHRTNPPCHRNICCLSPYAPMPLCP